MAGTVDGHTDIFMSEKLVIPTLPVSARIPAECELLTNKSSPRDPTSAPVVAVAHETEEKPYKAPTTGRVRSLMTATSDQTQENSRRSKRQRKPPSAFEVSFDSKEEYLMRKAMKASLLDTKIEEQAEVAEGKTYR